MALDLTSFRKALKQLETILGRAEDEGFMSAQDDITRDAIRAGVIQHFEIVYELSWKLTQRWIRTNLSPEEATFPRTRKELFRTAARAGLIADPMPWFAFGDARNLTSHTYDEETAATVYAEARPLSREARHLLEQLEDRND